MEQHVFSVSELNRLVKDLLDAGMTVEMNVASVGSIYPITDESNPAAQGQLTAVAEIKGETYEGWVAEARELSGEE